MNKVIGYDYYGYKVCRIPRGICLKKLFDKVEIHRQDVEFVQVMDVDKQQSVTRMMARGFLFKNFGRYGGLFGGLSAKARKSVTVSMQLTSGRTCLMEVNERIYKIIMRELYH